MTNLPTLTMGGLTDGTPANEADVSTPVMQLWNGVNDVLDGSQAFGKINFDSDAKTIALGAVTITNTYTVLDTEGGASSDDLVTINGGSDGDIILLTQTSPARIVTVKSGTGNISLTSGDVILSTTSPLILIKMGSTWCSLVTNSVADPSRFQARLSATTGVAVPTSDVTAGTKLYLTPYKGNKITLRVGSKWQEFTLTSDIELDVSAGVTANWIYDIFVYSNSGVPTLFIRGWLNDTTRANNLAFIDGIPMCSEIPYTDRRYVGTVRMYTAGTPIRDSVIDRGIWNFYHRVPRALSKTDATNHAYTTIAWRAWNADATQIVSFVQGIQEQGLGVSIRGTWTGTAACGVGASLNGEAAPDTFCYFPSGAGQFQSSSGFRTARLGWNYLTAYEIGAAGITFNGYLLQGLWEC